MKIYTNNDVRRALNFASVAHAGDIRKGTNIPYIVHPFEVYQILKENKCSLVVQIAGLLHDTLEDTATTPDQLLDLFGEEVLSIVENESEDKSKTWQERKQATITQLATASIETLQVCCGDKLSNIRSMAFDLETIGDNLWNRFNAPKEKISWYYKSLGTALEPLSEYPMFTEYLSLVEKVFS